MHFGLFWLGLCPWDKKPQNRRFFCHNKSQRRAFALESIQSSPKNVLQARSSPQHDSAQITNFLKWPCIGTVARQEQLLLAPPDGQNALSVPFTPQLFPPQAATVSMLWVRAPVPWLQTLSGIQGADPKLASGQEQLNGWTKWVIPYSKMSICSFPQGSLPLHLSLFFSLTLCGMWVIRGVRGCSSISWLETLQYVIFSFGLLWAVLAYRRSAIYLQARNICLQ